MSNNNIQLENGDYVAVFKKSDHGRAGHIQFKNMKHKTSTGEIYDIQFNSDEKVADKTKENIPLFFASLLGQFGGGKKKMTRRKLKKQKRRRKSSTQKNT